MWFSWICHAAAHFSCWCIDLPLSANTWTIFLEKSSMILNDSGKDYKKILVNMTYLWSLHWLTANRIIEPERDKTNKMTCASSKDSDQPAHPPSLIRVFAVCFMGSKWPNASVSGQWRLWSDWADAQADSSLPWAHMSFCLFCLVTAIRINNQSVSCSKGLSPF